jgi:hypothetical protein
MSEAETDTLGGGRTILSESRLATLLQKAETRLFDGPELGSPIEISLSDMPALVRHWSEAIARKAATLRKHAMGTLEALPTGCLYEHFDQTMWKRAALASEIFRHPEVSKNSGWLHTRALQEKFVKASVDGRIELLIAWGQPKRNAGGLKTPGSLADLAELYAIARLGMIVTAIRSVLERDVDLTVLSGGRRFAQALYTDPVLAAKYDAQRQEIANLLCGRGVMMFCDYVSADFRDSARWAERYRETLEKITAEMIASEFSTVLLNVDWDNVFSAADGNTDPRAQRSTHLPPNLCRWLGQHPANMRPTLIQAAITCILNPRYQAYWQERLGDREDVVQNTVDFMRAFAWECTRKYIALHHADGVEAAETPHGHRIRLTVHEKRNRPDVPAIFTLGRRGGNLLSQHVAVRIQSGGEVKFETLMEIREHDAHPVVLGAPGSAHRALFEWLASAGQPLCFIDGETTAPLELLGRILDD